MLKHDTIRLHREHDAIILKADGAEIALKLDQLSDLIDALKLGKRDLVNNPNAQESTFTAVAVRP